MHVEKRLLIYATSALIVGVLSIAPLTLSMLHKPIVQSVHYEAWFNASIPYAFCALANGITDSKPETIFGSLLPEKSKVNQTLDPEYAEFEELILLNFTLERPLEYRQANAQIEYFMLQIESDKTPIINHTYSVGTSNTNAFELEGFHFEGDSWFDSNTTEGGSFMNNWTTGESKLSSIQKSDRISRSNSPEGAYTILKEAKFLTIHFQRIGAVTFYGNSVVVNPTNQSIQTIQLQRHEGGFFYGSLFSNDMLAQIDLRNPFNQINERT